ncbi:MAG TPA: bifunctional nuclease domain-containing protein [Candidatus Binataceae bacterium]
MKPVGGIGLCLLLLAAFVAACAGEHAPAIPPDQIKVEVSNVGYDRDTQAHFVMLEDRGKRRELPILIGDNEAQAIMLELHGIKPERPLTHDLLRSVIEQTGNKIDRVLIGELRDEVYYAKIYLDKGRYAIDSRPSDAIALAMGVNAPIYVSDKLFESAPALSSAPGSASAPELAQGWGITVQPLTPDLAGYFGVSGVRGVLVAEVDAGAKKAGLERGDIIVKVGTRDIKALDDFSRGVAAVKNGGGAAVLTLRRNGADQTVTLQPSR